jgi:hypothetical protein
MRTYRPNTANPAANVVQRATCSCSSIVGNAGIGAVCGNEKPTTAMHAAISADRRPVSSPTSSVLGNACRPSTLDISGRSRPRFRPKHPCVSPPGRVG